MPALTKDGEFVQGQYCDVIDSEMGLNIETLNIWYRQFVSLDRVLDSVAKLILKDDFSVFFTSELNAGYDTPAYLKHISGTFSTQSSLFTS